MLELRKHGPRSTYCTRGLHVQRSQGGGGGAMPSSPLQQHSAAQPVAIPPKVEICFDMWLRFTYHNYSFTHVGGLVRLLRFHYELSKTAGEMGSVHISG